MPRRSRIRTVGLVATVLWLGGAGAARAETLVVDGGSVAVCSDDRSGVAADFGLPWCTPRAALAAAGPGATVLLRKGTYDKVALSRLDRSDPVTLAPYPGERPVVEGMEIEDVRGLVVRDLRLTDGIYAARSRDIGLIGNEVALTPRGAKTHSGFILHQVTDSLVQGNHVHDGRDGLNFDDADPPSSNVAIIGNHFEDLGNDAIHITSDHHDIFIARNVIEDVRLRADVDPGAHADGIQALGPTRNIQVVSNFVIGGRGFLFMVSPRDAALPGRAHEDLVIANNVLAGRDFGLRLFSTRGARVVNNTVWGLTTGGLDVFDRVGENAHTAQMVLANNIVKKLTVGPGVGFAVRARNLVAEGPVTAQDLQGAPGFADAAGLDFGLREDSPAVDAGLGGVAPLVDHLGRARRGAPDIGALELGGTLVSPPAAAPPAAPAAPSPGPPPSLDAFELAPRRLTDRATDTRLVDLEALGGLGGPGAATLAWTTQEASLAFVRIDRRVRGRRRTVAFLVRVALPGVNTTPLTGRLGGRRLAPGRYTATVALLDQDLNASRTRTRGFRVGTR